MKIGDPRAVGALGKATNSSDKDIRRIAVSALGLIRSISSVEHLIGKLNDSDANVRAKAASGLGNQGDCQCLDKLIPIATCDRSADVRRAAVEALGQFADLRVIDPLITALSDGEYSVRISAASALGKIDDLRAEDPFLQDLGVFDFSYRKNRVALLVDSSKELHAEILRRLCENPLISVDDVVHFQLMRYFGLRIRKNPKTLYPLYPEVLERCRSKQHIPSE